MTCPTCKQENILSLATRCPNCSTNLVAFKKLVALEEKYVESAKTVVSFEGKLVQERKKHQEQLRKKNRQNFFLWSLLLLSLILYYFFGRLTPKEIIAAPINKVDSIALYQDKLVIKDTEIEELNRKLKAIQGTKIVRELKYIVKKGDVLNNLGKLFYNDSTAWYQIALDNKIYDIRGLPVGDTLTINYRE